MSSLLSLVRITELQTTTGRRKVLRFQTRSKSAACATGIFAELSGVVWLTVCTCSNLESFTPENAVSKPALFKKKLYKKF